MILLNTTTKSFEFVLGAAITTTALDFTCSYIDLGSSGTTVNPGENDGTSNNTTPVSLAAAPGSGVQRIIKFISITNKDTVAATVTISYNNNSTLRTLFKAASLSVGDQLIYTDTYGFSILDSAGNEKNTIISGCLIRISSYGTTTSTKHTVDAKCKRARVKMIGGGGGGAGVNGNTSQVGVGGGGGSGGYCEKDYTVTGGTRFTVVSGGGGAGGLSGTNNGSDGSDSTCTDGTTTITAKGGKGGISLAAGTSAISALGGAISSISTNGDINGYGQPGEPGVRLSGTIGLSGAGGYNIYGGGGRGLVVAQAGIDGNLYGSGGSGAISTAAVNRAGGAGANGIIIIEEYT